MHTRQRAIAAPPYGRERRVQRDCSGGLIGKKAGQPCQVGFASFFESAGRVALRPSGSGAGESRRIIPVLKEPVLRSRLTSASIAFVEAKSGQDVCRNRGRLCRNQLAHLWLFRTRQRSRIQWRRFRGRTFRRRWLRWGAFRRILAAVPEVAIAVLAAASSRLPGLELLNLKGSAAITSGRRCQRIVLPPRIQDGSRAKEALSLAFVASRASLQESLGTVRGLRSANGR